MKFFASKAQVPFLLIITTFTVYLSTMAPVVYLGDSGELTAGAFALGVPHASGYPLYSLLGKIFCMLPLGNIGFRMNLMSGFFLTLTVLLVYTIILRATSSALSAAVAALFLAFTPLFWSQSVSAEVYPLHIFFLALMIRLLWWWENNRAFRSLLVFVFVTGLSFGNHLQTVMLAPAVLFFIISGDKIVLFRLRNFIAITLFFVLALTLYLYLPIRTDAGAAIHWGDPDSIERFLAHVTARAHRGTYVFSIGLPGYASRAVETIRAIGTQYGVLLLLALWGWLKLPSMRWKVFFVVLVFFDFAYTVFLNIISLEITPFSLNTTIVIAILLGIGVNDILRLTSQWQKIGTNVKKSIKFACCMLPAIPFLSNYCICNQRHNYSAYEHTVNIFRTAEPGSTVFLDGDNNVFPVVYGRMVEGMGAGVTLYDYQNLIFRWTLNKYPFTFKGTWKEFRAAVQKKIIEERANTGVYFCVFAPFAVSVPKGYHLSPYGILNQVVADKFPLNSDIGDDIWDYYYMESMRESFIRDCMNRQLCAYYYLRRGENLWRSGLVVEGLRDLGIASSVGYDDRSVHSDIAIFLTDRGFFEEARKELEKALLYHNDFGGVLNNWGYYYYKTGDYEKAIASLYKAVQMNPDNYEYHNNLAFSLHRAGKREEARLVFHKSLIINENQPVIKEFMEKHGLQ